MTETAKMADVVLPATQFLEHDDIYKGGGHQYLMLGPKVVDAPDGPRENLVVLNALAKRLGADQHPGFHMTAREHIDWMLRNSGYGTLEELEQNRWIDLQPDFESAHYLNGFAHADGKFHFRPDWGRSASPNKSPIGPLGPWTTMPELPDHWEYLEHAGERHPFRLVTAPARSFLNSTFNETESSQKKEKRPEVWMLQADAEDHGINDGDLVEMGNNRGIVTLHARYVEGLTPGTVISEGIWPNEAFPDGKGINTLTGADPAAPYGGAAFHDTAVWVQKV
jgi:anaerobic selenocysteine-containing dehydrogenase